jgi:hypothetical protein
MGIMSESTHEVRARPLWAAILSDVHFWVPAIILVIGLILLRLVQ